MSAGPDLLVLGATSLVGRPLLARLAEQARPAYALSRAERPPAAGVTWLTGDLTRPAALALPPVAACLSLSPIWLLAPAVSLLADAGVTRLAALSSTSVFTKAASVEASERAVAEQLARGEAEVIAACEAGGIDWTILRPTLIYDPGRDANVTRLADLIQRFGFLPLAGRGEGRRQPVHADDLAVGALTALDAPATHGRAYDLPGGETLTYRQMAERIYEGLGRRSLILALPAPVWRTAFALASPLLPGATASMGSRMDADLVFDGEPARRDFGWNPRAFRPRFT